MLNQLNLSLRTQPASLPYKCKARLRVKLGPRAVQLARQLFPCEQTSSAGLAMTVSCQFRTHAPQQDRSLFDHVVGAGEQRGRYGKTKRLCGLEIDDQLEFAGLQDRQVIRLLARKNSPGVSPRHA